MAKLIYFPLYIDRWIAGTMDMTFEERGFYISLLVWMYSSGKPIKDSDHAARILRCNPRTSRKLWGRIQPKFRLTSAGIRHRLCDELLRNAGKLKELEDNNFPLRARKKPDPEPDPEELGDNSSSPSQDSDSGDPTKGRGSYSVRNRNFAPFWSSYPIKRGKKRAEAIWKRKDLDKHSEMIIQDVERRKTQDQQWANGYIPNPATYLNQERWEDELESPHRNQAKRPMSNVERLRMEMPEFFVQEEVIEGEVVKKEIH